MLMSCILILAALGALGVCFWLGGFASLAFLWQLPLLFGGFWLGLLLLAFLFLVLWCLPISMEQPVEEDSKTARRVLYLYEELVLALLQVKIHTTGLEKLPREGRFLLVCNHLSLLDPLILHIHTKESQLAFISKRENDREALKTILKCVDILKTDRASIAVFPEGYTSRTGHLQPFRNGVFKIAQKAKVPIVICTLRGAAPIFHNAARLRRTHVSLDLLEVIPASQLQSTTRQIGDHIYAVMAQNLGEPIPNPDQS